MAQFEGTIKEFMRFIGPHARIIVWNISQKYRKKIGRCEDCGSTTKLEAAHVKGKERPLLISNILCQFFENDIIRIDLNEFEERFIEAHLPIESSIRILCNFCHKKYDNSKEIAEIVPGSIEEAKLVNLENKGLKEDKIIEQLVKEKGMNKSKAIDIARSKSLTSIDHSNTLFSNINAAQDVWWLEPSNIRFQSVLYFILNNDKTQTLYIFRLPANTIKNANSHFHQRNDRVKTNASDIYIPVSGIKFCDKKGFDFSKYLIEKIEY